MRDLREFYLILGPALDALKGVAKSVRMTLTVNYAGEPFIWPVPTVTGLKPHAADIAKHAAAEAAVESWIRISWNRNGAYYDVSRRQVNTKAPEWPSQVPDASSMLRIACKTGGMEVIDGPDHPVVQELLGLS
jgi:hypothetical protein